jgi:acyl-CoA synthetase (AMP-forming)/AMP-acid ligase II
MKRPVEGLLDWFDAPHPEHGFRFAQDDGSWSLLTYEQLAGKAGSAAEQIEQLRSRRGGFVSIVARTGPDFLAAFIGALIAGDTPSPLVLPLFARDRQRYVEHAAGVLAATNPSLILAEPEMHEIVDDAAALAGVAGRARSLQLDGPPVTPFRRPPAELALLQFTSGSSGRPRGVRVTWRNLEHDIALILSWLAVGSEDETASWLPLYHDMGLIGCFLTPMINRSNVWVMRPEQFVADPLRWLDCFGRKGAEIAVGPNFGFAYANRRISDEQLEGSDFSDWRIAIAGAERLDPAALGRFAARLRPHGFRPATFMPAYGLAEATLAVTGVPPARVPRTVRPGWSQARIGAALELSAQASLDDTEAIGDGAGWVVGSGDPHPSVEVEIVDDDGAALPEAHLGEIVVSGPIVADGYERDGDSPSATTFAGGRLQTGDAGFLLDGELFVLGRLGDSVKIRGRTVFVEDVESRLASIDGIPKGRCVVMAGIGEDGELIAALVEAPAGDWVEPAVSALRNAVGPSAIVRILAGEPGAIERTSSGKPRRRVMWLDLLGGELAGEVVYDSAVTV